MLNPHKYGKIDSYANYVNRLYLFEHNISIKQINVIFYLD